MSNRSILLVAGSALALLCSTAAMAAPQGAAKTLSSSQQKMSECAKANAGKKGAAYKSGVSACLKGEAAAPVANAKQTQREKMKSCNADASAKSLKGATRKQFMSTCLKGSH